MDCANSFSKLMVDFPYGSVDPSEIQPFLELRLLMREFEYSLQSGMLKIRCLNFNK